MNEKIIDMICKLVDTGSSTAIWFYTIYVVGVTLKYLIGFGCLLLSVHKVARIVKEVWGND